MGFEQKGTKETKENFSVFVVFVSFCKILPTCVGQARAHDGRTVRKRRIYLALVGLGIVIGGIVVLSRPEREPEYGGKKLSEWILGRPWMVHYGGASIPLTEEARAAIQAIGAEAIPYLAEWMRDEPAAWKRKLYSARNPIIRRVTRSWQIKEFMREQLAEGARQGLVALGSDRPIPSKASSEAERVIPELTRLLNDPTAFTSARRAAHALSCLGSAGLPPLMGALTNRTERPLHPYILERIGEMGTNARPAIPCLLRMLRDGDPNVRLAAATVVRKIGPSGIQANSLPVIDSQRVEIDWLRLENAGKTGESLEFVEPEIP